MKKRTSLALCFMILLSCLPIFSSAYTLQGSGTVSSPYVLPVIEDYGVGFISQQGSDKSYKRFPADPKGPAYILLKTDLTQLPQDMVWDGASVEFSALFSSGGTANVNAKIYATTENWSKTDTTATTVAEKISNGTYAYVGEQLKAQYIDTKPKAVMNISSVLKGLNVQQADSLTMILSMNETSNIYYYGNEYTGSWNYTTGKGPANIKPEVAITRGYTGSGTTLNPYLIPAINSTLVSGGTVTKNLNYSNTNVMQINTKNTTFGLLRFSTKALPVDLNLSSLTLNGLFTTNGNVVSNAAKIYVTPQNFDKSSASLAEVQEMISTAFLAAENVKLSQYGSASAIKDYPLGEALKNYPDAEEITVILDYSNEGAAVLFGHDASTINSDNYNSHPHLKIVQRAPQYTGAGTEAEPYLIQATKSKMVSNGTNIYQNGTNKIWINNETGKENYAIMEMPLADLLNIGSDFENFGAQLSVLATTYGSGSGGIAKIYATQEAWTSEATFTTVKALATSGIFITSYDLVQWAGAVYVKKIDLNDLMKKIDLSKEHLTLILQLDESYKASFHGHDATEVPNGAAIPTLRIFDVNAKVESLSKIYSYADDNIPMGVVFATAKGQLGRWSRTEYGMEFSKTAEFEEKIMIPADSIEGLADRNGNYGFKFLGKGLKLNQVYYARPYAIYSFNGEVTTVYGSVIEFEPLAQPE